MLRSPDQNKALMHELGGGIPIGLQFDFRWYFVAILLHQELTYRALWLYP